MADLLFSDIIIAATLVKYSAFLVDLALPLRKPLCDRPFIKPIGTMMDKPNRTKSSRQKPLGPLQNRKQVKKSYTDIKGLGALVTDWRGREVTAIISSCSRWTGSTFPSLKSRPARHSSSPRDASFPATSSHLC